MPLERCLRTMPRPVGKNDIMPVLFRRVSHTKLNLSTSMALRFHTSFDCPRE